MYICMQFSNLKAENNPRRIEMLLKSIDWSINQIE